MTKKKIEKKTLILPLKTQWFEMTKAGIKTEDYREITPYWCNKFLLFSKMELPILLWTIILEYLDTKAGSIAQINIDWPVSFIKFDKNKVTKGYPNKKDTSRIVNLAHKGIKIGTGKPEWGAEPDKYYFIIKHGKIL